MVVESRPCKSSRMGGRGCGCGLYFVINRLAGVGLYPSYLVIHIQATSRNVEP